MRVPVVKCFISHSREDSPEMVSNLSERLSTWLRTYSSRRSQVFYDGDLKATTEHEATIKDVMGDHHIFVPLVTLNWLRAWLAPNDDSGKYCRREYEWFMEAHGVDPSGDSLPSAGAIIPLVVARDKGFITRDSECPPIRVFAKLSPLNPAEYWGAGAAAWDSFVGRIAETAVAWADEHSELFEWDEWDREPPALPPAGPAASASVPRARTPSASTPGRVAVAEPVSTDLCWSDLVRERGAELIGRRIESLPDWLDLPTAGGASLKTPGYRELVDQLIHRLGSGPLAATSEAWFRSLVTDMNSAN